MWFSSILLLATAASELYQQGAAAIQRGAVAEALKPLSRAVELEPNNAQYRKALGVAYAAQELYRDAEEQFGSACRLNASLPDVCYYHARALYVLNRFEPAIEVLRKIQTKGVREHTALAQANDALGRVAAAEAAYIKACASQGATRPAPEPPCMLYGVFLFRQGRLDEAIQRLEEAAKAVRHARTEFELGRALYQGGRLQAAIEHLQNSVELGYGEAAELLLQKARRRAASSP